MHRISKIITFLNLWVKADDLTYCLKVTFKPFFYFWPLYNPIWVILIPLTSNWSMMPAWHQRVSLLGHVEESETARKLQRCPTSIFQVHSFVCHLYYLKAQQNESNLLVLASCSEPNEVIKSFLIIVFLYDAIMSRFRLCDITSKTSHFATLNSI